MKRTLLTALATSLLLPLSLANAAAVNYQPYLSQARQLTKKMNIDEKIGQMTLVKFVMLEDTNNKVDWSNLQKYHIGAMLIGGGEVPDGHGGFIAGMLDAPKYLNSTRKAWVGITNQAKANAPTIDNGALRLPLLLGIDAVHGDQSILGNTTFPQNIALSMTHDLQVVEQAEHWTAEDIKASGFNWAYAPTVAVSHSPSWGRYSETLGNDLDWVAKYSQAMVDGLQQTDTSTNQITGVLATAKHFIGDGATFDGDDEGNDHVNAGGLERLLNVNKAGYVSAVKDAGVGSIMVSYSAINGLPMSFNKNLVTKGFKDGALLGTPFNGLVVSDYGAVEKAALQGWPATGTTTPFDEALAKSVNAGIDLFMITSTAQSYKDVAGFQAILKREIESNHIHENRIDNAVIHILAVKMAMGLLKKDKNGKWVTNQPPQTYTARTKANTAEVNTAVSAAEKSFVLLKNRNVLPLNKSQIKYVVLTGEPIVNTTSDEGTVTPTLYPSYDNIGAQNGGWTVAWQGSEGNTFWQGHNKKTSGATTIIDGIEKAAPGVILIYPHYNSDTNIADIKATRSEFLKNLKKDHPGMTAANTVIVGVLAEIPSAEFMGDIKDANDYQHGSLYDLHVNAYLPNKQSETLTLDYQKFSKSLIKTVKAQVGEQVPLVTVLMSGRPRIIQNAKNNDGPLDQSQAFIAAWWPGTSGGQAIANALFGDYHFVGGGKGHANTLSSPWLRDMTQLDGFPVYTAGKGVVTYDDPLFSNGYGLSD